MKSFIVGAIVASAGLFSASSAAAAFIVNPVSATSSINNSGYSPNNTILGYPTSGLTAGSPWPTATGENLGGGVGYWQEYAPYSGLSIQWDLGSVQSLVGMHVWNFNFGLNEGNLQDQLGRGMQVVDVQVSTNGTFWTDLSNTTLALGTGFDNYTGASYSLTPSTARFVEFNLVTGGDGNAVGLSGIQFQAVPEPATLVMLGIGGVGVLVAGRAEIERVVP